MSRCAPDRAPAPGRPVGARVRAAAVRAARRQRGVLRRARQHDVRHRGLRARLHARAAAAGRGPRVGGGAHPARAGLGAPARADRAARGGARAAAARRRARRARSRRSPSRCWSGSERRSCTRARRSCARSSPSSPPRRSSSWSSSSSSRRCPTCCGRARRRRGRGPASSSTPIVHIVLDELPMSTLTAPDGSIDAELFPNLARFAAGATWYRNATTVADTTSEAVPAQVTGELPEVGELPTSTHHPRSLFTLFRRSHEFSVVEPITDVCPARLCPEARPPVRARLSALADDLDDRRRAPAAARRPARRAARDRPRLGGLRHRVRPVDDRHQPHADRATSSSGR